MVSGEWLLGGWCRFSGRIWATWERILGWITDGCQEEEEGESFAGSDFTQLPRPGEMDNVLCGAVWDLEILTSVLEFSSF